MTRSLSTTSDRAAGGLLGSLLIGFLGAATMAGLMLASGQGVLMALLVYSLSGALLMVAAAAAQQLIAAATLHTGRHRRSAIDITA